MTPPIVLITPTRDRPEAFGLCESYVRRFLDTVPKFTWLVIDDGDVPCDPKGGIHIRREPSKTVNTLPHNLLAALEHPSLTKPEGQFVLMIEDDEWYHPDYVKVMCDQLARAGKGFVGQANARYYHLAHRTWWCPNNQQHASLCRTSWVHKSTEASWIYACAYDAFRAQDPFIDMRVWSRRALVHEPAVKLAVPELKLLRSHSHLTVGIKGMPGRGGLGSAHTGGSKWTPDPEGDQLETWTTEEDRDTYFAITGARAATPAHSPASPRARHATRKGRKRSG